MAGAAKAEEGPPPPGAVLVVYAALGAALSFGCGREPGTMASEFEDFALPAVAMSLFVALYSLYDVMGVGILKAEKKAFDKKRDEVDEDIDLANRALTNQVEQMAAFFVTTALFALFVNGPVGGLLASLWVLLRRGYAMRYRSSVGVPFMAKKLGQYTIPCYFILNSMALAVVVQIARATIHNEENNPEPLLQEVKGGGLFKKVFAK